MFNRLGFPCAAQNCCVTAISKLRSSRSTSLQKYLPGWSITFCAILLAVGPPLHAQAPVTIAVSGNINSRGSMTLWIDSYSKAIRYGEFSTAGSLAAGFGGTISLDASAPVWAKGFPDGTIQMVLRYGSVSNIHVDITPDGGSGQGGGSSSPPITISANPGSVGGGTLPTGTTLYSYSITAANGSSGYDPVGNITAYSDSANAQWTASYDNLYRLTGAVQSSSTKQFSTSWGKATQQFLCWQYDSFGNRLQQASSSSPFANGQNCAPVGGAAYDAAALNVNSHNQIVNLNFTYDASGDLTGDGIYSYQYDGAGRLCAVRKNVTGMMVGYLYDASGRRVAKGTLNPQTGNWCDMATNGFSLTSRDVVGLDGQTLTEFDSAGTSHSNILLAGGVEATLTAQPNTQTVTHYQFTDWLGTRRLQTDALGSPEEICSGGAFGDAVNCTGEAATVRHFTGQERDRETEHVVGTNDGLDYFGARHYDSALGRFISPDWNSDPDSVPNADFSNPQSLNLYSYVLNNPLKDIDSDGHITCDPDTWNAATNTLQAGRCHYDFGDLMNSVEQIAQQTTSALSNAAQTASHFIATNQTLCQVAMTANGMAGGALAGGESGGALGAVTGSTGGTFVAPLIGTVGGGAGGAAIGATIGSVGGGMAGGMAGYAASNVMCKGGGGNGGGGGGGRGALQKGGNSISKATANALNKATGKNLSPREWGRAVEELKQSEGLPPNSHGTIMSNGDYISANGANLGNLAHYLP